MNRRAPCPCQSERPYERCCEPFHENVSEAPDAESLMRSRYSAFALKRVEYLLKTLHPDHPDRAAPEAAVLASLRRSATEHRYMGLEILDRAAPDEAGIARVLFLAKVFLKGRDVSFVECSDFTRDGVGWRYLAGVGMVASRLRDELPRITIARFLERAST